MAASVVWVLSRRHEIYVYSNEAAAREDQRRLKPLDFSVQPIKVDDKPVAAPVKVR